MYYAHRGCLNPFEQYQQASGNQGSKQIGYDSANSEEFRGIRPRMFIEDLLW